MNRHTLNVVACCVELILNSQIKIPPQASKRALLILENTQGATLKMYIYTRCLCLSHFVLFHVKLFL